MIAASSKPSGWRNASATLAFQKFRSAQQDNEEERKKPLNVEIEEIDGKFHGKLYVSIAGTLKAGILLGPTRTNRPEAVLDAIELGKGFVREGEFGVHRVEKNLERKVWTPKEIQEADEGSLELFALPHDRRSQALGLQEGGMEQPLIPPGEGWARHDEEMLVNPHSQVYFSQLGARAGRYFMRDPQLREVAKPHIPQEHPILLRTASASWVRKGAKLDRAVLLNDISKIARLALKFPLSFVDLPACAYALFQGHRSAESAQWCAENFHKKLLPLLAGKIHTYEVEELQSVLQKTLEALDVELLKSPHSFSGCSALVALVLGERLVLAGVGQVRAVLIPETGPLQRVLTCRGPLSEKAERDRVQDAGGIIRDGFVCNYSIGEAQDEAARIRSARHAFEVLQIGFEVWATGLDEKQVRSSYRKLALRVHPDKQADGADIDAFKSAFARLDPAKEALEAMLGADLESCKEIHKVLCSDVHTRVGAATLLGVDKVAAVDTAQVVKDAEKASKDLTRRLDKMQAVSPDYKRAVAMYKEAVETLRIGCTPEALPRHEALLKEGIPTGCALAARDLRRPQPIVLMEPQTASVHVPAATRCRLALLCGGTAALSDGHLVASTANLTRQPKASALRWCLDADSAEKCSSAVCLGLEYGGGDEAPPTKKLKSASAGPEGTMRLRHILFRHQQLKASDLMARREGTARTAQEAEGAALEALEKLIKDPNLFLRLCRQLSDCQTGEQPGMLSGDLGWVARGQQEQAFDDAAFSLKPNEFGDLVTTSRGIHIIQRLA